MGETMPLPGPDHECPTHARMQGTDEGVLTRTWSLELHRLRCSRRYHGRRGCRDRTLEGQVVRDLGSILEGHANVSPGLNGQLARIELQLGVRVFSSQCRQWGICQRTPPARL